MQKITTIPKLIAYLETKPPRTWTVCAIDDGKGRHCVLGHLWPHVAAGKLMFLRMGIDPMRLVGINNGSGNPRTTGSVVKARVIKYLRSFLPR